MDLEQMQHAAAETATLLRALGHPDRLLVLCQLAQGECSVGELEQQLGIQQPQLSQQLAVLRADNHVSTRREGKRIFYSIRDPRLNELLGTLYRLYCPQTLAP